MLHKLIQKLKQFLNDLDYNWWMDRIMSDAIEYDEDPEIVDAFLQANHENHKLPRI